MKVKIGEVEFKATVIEINYRTAFRWALSSCDANILHAGFSASEELAIADLRATVAKLGGTVIEPPLVGPPLTLELGMKSRFGFEFGLSNRTHAQINQDGSLLLENSRQQFWITSSEVAKLVAGLTGMEVTE